MSSRSWPGEQRRPAGRRHPLPRANTSVLLALPTWQGEIKGRCVSGHRRGVEVGISQMVLLKECAVIPFTPPPTRSHAPCPPPCGAPGVWLCAGSRRACSSARRRPGRSGRSGPTCGNCPPPRQVRGVKRHWAAQGWGGTARAAPWCSGTSSVPGTSVLLSRSQPWWQGWWQG